MIDGIITKYQRDGYIVEAMPYVDDMAGLAAAQEFYRSKFISVAFRKDSRPILVVLASNDEAYEIPVGSYIVRFKAYEGHEDEYKYGVNTILYFGRENFHKLFEPVLNESKFDQYVPKEVVESWEI